MTSVKVPVLVTRYADSLYTARVIDGPDADAAAPTAADAFASVRDFLRKQGAREPHQYWPKIERFELCRTAVRVRLYYRDGKRQFPASREMKLPVRYVLGHYVDDSVECFLVDYDLVFHCPTLRELPQLIAESVRGAAARIDSRKLIAATPPAESELRLVRVRLKEPRVRFDSHLTETLAVVANPIAQRQRKRRSVPVKHRDNETFQLTMSMSDTCLLLVGPPGCGKTTIAQLAARQHQAAMRELAKRDGQEPPPPLVWETSAENLIAGMQYLGEWEARLEQVIAELDSIGGILTVTSLIDLVRLGGSQPTDSLAAFLMPYVRRGEIRMIVEATDDEMDAARRLLPGLVECFQLVSVAPLSNEQTREVATTMLSDAARNHRIEIEDTAAETVTRLFAQFMPYQSPPRGVVQLISDAVEEATRRAAPVSDAPVSDAPVSDAPVSDAPDQDRQPVRIGNAELIARFTQLTGLPETMLRDSVKLRGEEVREQLRRSVIGQDAAVESVAGVVLKLKAGLCDPGRPVAVMMFCGPTGVGKTQLARSLADYLFGQTESKEQMLIRLDMSEYASWDAVDRFLVADDGEVAAWIGQLRARPMSVVLLDEFEKASPEVHDCLLSALDEGRLSDRFGRTTTLCGSILVLTSNVGSRSNESLGFGGHDSSALRRAIEQEFRPEFLNRLDEVVTFDPLPPSVIEQIVEKELRTLQQREGLTNERVKLRWNQELVRRIAAVGFDPLLGARPLQRAIEREVVAKVARRILDREDRGQPLTIDLNDLNITSGDSSPNDQASTREGSQTESPPSQSARPGSARPESDWPEPTGPEPTGPESSE